MSLKWGARGGPWEQDLVRSRSSLLSVGAAVSLDRGSWDPADLGEFPQLEGGDSGHSL